MGGGGREEARVRGGAMCSLGVRSSEEISGRLKLPLNKPEDRGRHSPTLEAHTHKPALLPCPRPPAPTDPHMSTCLPCRCPTAAVGARRAPASSRRPAPALPRPAHAVAPSASDGRAGWGRPRPAAAAAADAIAGPPTQGEVQRVSGLSHALRVGGAAWRTGKHCRTQQSWKKRKEKTSAPRPSDLIILPSATPSSADVPPGCVIIVGAGIAGLATALALYRVSDREETERAGESTLSLAHAPALSLPQTSTLHPRSLALSPPCP